MRREVAFLIASLIAVMTAGDAAGQNCPTTPLCRDVAPAGALLHKPNSSGRLVWTAPCGQSTNRRPPDPICTAIINSPQTGGFGKFISAVTSQCREKHFGSYFGLDGLTFGILDWTASNLPGVLRAYQLRSPEGFTRNFGYLHDHFTGQCLDAKWVCQANRQALLSCDAGFHASFSTAIESAEFRKAEMDFARLQYEARLKRFAPLGLKTEYGATTLAVLANNLTKATACRPERLVEVCRAAGDEHAQVECILDTYVAHACRGSTPGSKERATAIRAAFKGQPPSTLIDPSVAQIEQSVPDWNAR